ncbi:MAG: PaaI family thioesterase [Betaproteobacteria bacterium]|nr:PaaI family thioesterase [Betaproteobacteria bacterium]NBT10238.1 PaaI family thioesterase [Betaproteobacteria bacterium]NBU49399.1 PaaI family thioesterase [Betaproteobacteria bacterium]
MTAPVSSEASTLNSHPSPPQVLTQVPFADFIGLNLVRMQDGEAELTVAMKPELLNTWQVAHGGVTMTLLDVTMAHAARSLNMKGADKGPGVVTVEMKTTFMRPGEGHLVCRARVLHRSSTMAYTEGSVYSANGLLCAHATGIFKYLRALPASTGLRVLHPKDGQA